MFELFMYVLYSCNALSARFFDVDRALNSYFMIYDYDLWQKRMSKFICSPSHQCRTYLYNLIEVDR